MLPPEEIRKTMWLEVSTIMPDARQCLSLRRLANPKCTVVGVAQDVTDDRKHAQELREMQYYRASQEAKVETERNMTAYFAHELRNPLGAIDSALTAMPDDLSPCAADLVNAMKLCTGEFLIADYDYEIACS